MAQPAGSIAMLPLVADERDQNAGRGTLAVLSLAMLMPSLATSIANAALPALAQAFASSFQAAQWIVLIYLLAITTLIVAVGRLGDLVGRRRLLLGGIALFTLASLLCGLAPNLWLLIAARAVQGAGAAIMMALSMAMVGDAVPKAKVGSAMGLLGTMSAVGTTLGPTLGGLLIAWTGWPAIFLISVPLGALAFVLGCRNLPADRVASRDGVRLDYGGIALLLLALTAYALAMTLGRFGLLGVGLLAVALIAGAAFLVIEARIASPLIDLRLLRDSMLRASLAANALVSTVMMATLVVGPFYLSRALSLDAALVGLVLSAGPLGATVTGVPAGRLVDRFGAGRMVSAGLAGMILGALLLSIIPERMGVAGYLVPILFLTAGYAIFQAANNTAIMVGAGSAERGLVSGLLNLSRNLGLISGASAMGAVFALGAGATDLVSASPEAIARGLRSSFALAAILTVLALAMMLRSQRRRSA